MRALRILASALVAMALVPLAAGAASAAPPGNDEVGGAVVLHLGDRDQQDTTQATTNAGDEALNANCGAPATNASVWYQYTPAVKRNVALDVSQSDYSAGVMVFEGTPTADSLVACGPGGVGLSVAAGKTYYVMAFSDTEVNGGNLVLALEKAPTPTVHVTLAKHGKAIHGRAGAARIHGTYKCRHGDSFAEVDSQLQQRAGRLKIGAEGGTSIRCDGQRHRWSTRLVSPVGTYAAGHAVAKAAIFVCGLVECQQQKVKRDVTLTWARGSHRQLRKPTSGLTERPHARYTQQRHWPSSY